MENQHEGKIIEGVIRKLGYTAYDVAILMGTSRRMIYHWFNMPRLNKSVILKFGETVGHDFAIDFNETAVQDRDLDLKCKLNFAKKLRQEKKLLEEIIYWKEAYRSLRAKYEAKTILISNSGQ